MILYHAITTYHILKCAVHKLANHPDEDAIVLVPSFLVRIPSGLKAPENSEIFSKIIFFDWERAAPGETLKSHMSEIDSILKKQLGNDFLEQATEINVCSAAYLFGIYLCYKEIPFQWFEEADGRYTNPYPIMEDDERIWSFRFELAKEYGLYIGDNKCVTKRLIKYDSQTGDFSGDNTVNFDVVSELAKLNEIGQTAILDLFDVPKDLCFQPHSALMLTQHFANMRQLTFEEHVLCYQLTADYYLDGYKVYYKWHPSDLMPYSCFMENAEMISGDFPSELLTLVCKNRLDIVSSISSTGVYNLTEISDRVLTFTEDYLKTFMQNHKYYFCAQMMKLFSDYGCVCIGLNEPQLRNMLYFGVGLNEIKPEFYNSVCEISPRDKSVYLIGSGASIYKADLESMFTASGESSVFVFFDESNCAVFSDICEPIVKKIHIRAIDKNEYWYGSFDRICIYSRDKNARRSVRQMKFVKQLINAGVEIEVCFDDDKDTRINALEGMLNATEDELIKCKAELEELRGNQK